MKCKFLFCLVCLVVLHSYKQLISQPKISKTYSCKSNILKSNSSFNFNLMNNNLTNKLPLITQEAVCVFSIN